MQSGLTWLYNFVHPSEDEQLGFFFKFYLAVTVWIFISLLLVMLTLEWLSPIKSGIERRERRTKFYCFFFFNKSWTIRGFWIFKKEIFHYQLYVKLFEVGDILVYETQMAAVIARVDVII